GYSQLLTRTHRELDLTDQRAVADFFREERPEYVFLAAAKVGGILANNTYRPDFIHENLANKNTVIHQSCVQRLNKPLSWGSSSIYPKAARQPSKAEYLLTGPLERTNDPYALEMIAGLKMCVGYNIQYGTDFIAVIPSNLYCPLDNFGL